MNFIRNIKTRIRNARKVVTQIKAGEWNPTNVRDSSGYPIYAKNVRYPHYVLWLAGGPLECKINLAKCTETTHYGFILAIYVWFSGARKLAKQRCNISFNVPEEL